MLKLFELFFNSKRKSDGNIITIWFLNCIYSVLFSVANAVRTEKLDIVIKTHNNTDNALIVCFLNFLPPICSFCYIFELVFIQISQSIIVHLKTFLQLNLNKNKLFYNKHYIYFNSLIDLCTFLSCNLLFIKKLYKTFSYCLF